MARMKSCQNPRCRNKFEKGTGVGGDRMCSKACIKDYRKQVGRMIEEKKKRFWN